MKFKSLRLARSVQPFVEFRTQNVAGKSDSGGGMRPIEFAATEVPLVSMPLVY